MNDLMVTFNESLPFDKALHEADVRGSITYAKALLQLDLLTDEELSEITTGLEAVEKGSRRRSHDPQPPLSY